MKRWLKQIRNLAVLFGLGAVLLCGGQPVHAGDSLSQVERTYESQRHLLQDALSRRAALLKEARKVADYITKLKKEASRGLLGLGARWRLPGVRAKAHKLAQRLEQIDQKVRAKESTLKRLNKRLRKAYHQRYLVLSKEARQKGLSATRKGQIALALKRARERVRVLFQKVAPKSKRNAMGWQVRVDPLDGPRELKDKARLLKDFEDRSQKRMTRLKKKIQAVTRHLRRVRRDNELEGVTQSELEDGALFDEKSTNPRAMAGDSRRTETKATDAVNTAKNTNAERGSHGLSNTAPGYAASPGAKISSPAPRTPKMTSTAQSSSVGNPTLRPHVGLLPNPLAPGTSGDPLKPAGTPQQKLKALKKYQQQLNAYIKRLRHQQQQILKRAKKLQAEEHRRRSRR